ncbi:MAG TPA: iron-sulfur cluster repair di-iron protein [Fulvivirga sp.]|nr:iron-sulfur cluster repair di-iron protein [Fulvivirga sp.]
MENLKERKIGTLVAEDYRYADVFKKHGIDFCCGGGITINAACTKHNLDEEQLIKELKAIVVKADQTGDYNNWELDRLADHIVNTHHEYVNNNLPMIRAYSEKVAQVHGGRHPETKDLLNMVEEMENELYPHMTKEEAILFPYVKEMLVVKRKSSTLDPVHFGTIKNPINAMLDEHDKAGSIMKEIASVTSNFEPPQDACTTYRVLFQKLKDFESDLFQHIHLENNILFPKAIVLESELNG